MKGYKHLSHVDKLLIDRDRSSETHKTRAIVNAIRTEFFAGEIRYTVHQDTIHVLHKDSHKNAVKGIQETAKHRFGLDTEILEKNGYRTVIKFN